MPINRFPEENAKRGDIGIPRVLNMYENYPFWFTFFTTLGFRVILSPTSTKKIYETGMDTISSDTACYPAKLVHGHVKWLVNHGVKRIFYPNINHEMKEDKSAPGHYNCPIVATYSQVIAGNMDDILAESGVEYIHPFLPYDSDSRLIHQLYKLFEPLSITKEEIWLAVHNGRQEDKAFKEEIRAKGAQTIKLIEEKGPKRYRAGRPALSSGSGDQSRNR